MYSSNIIWKYLFQMVYLIVSIFILYHLKISFTRNICIKIVYLLFKTKNEQQIQWQKITLEAIQNILWNILVEQYQSTYFLLEMFEVSLNRTSIRQAWTFVRYNNEQKKSNICTPIHVARGDHISQYVNGVIVGPSTEGQ